MPAQHLTRYPQNVCAVQENKNKNALRNESTAKLHKKLLGFARDGNYEKVGRLTEILIRDRGEKPAAEHYRAMILANTDTVNGSSAEVERLLEEMESDGIPFDSWICNAVLKVCQPSPLLVANMLI